MQDIMKKRLFLISSLFLGLLIFSGCGSDTTPMEDLKTASKEIDKIEKRSENVSSTDEAFQLMRDLNQEIKDVRGAVMALDAEYTDMKPGSEEFEKVTQTEEYKQKVAEFEKVNAQIDSSLATISKNMEPYKDKEQVDQMIQKLQDLLISR